MPQDHTLFVVLQENDDRIWREKLEFLKRYCGLAQMLTHPDYLCGLAALDIDILSQASWNTSGNTETIGTACLEKPLNGGASATRRESKRTSASPGPRRNKVAYATSQPTDITSSFRTRSARRHHNAMQSRAITLETAESQNSVMLTGIPSSRMFQAATTCKQRAGHN